MTSFGDLHLSVHDDGGNVFWKDLYPAMFCPGHWNFHVFKYKDRKPEQNIAGYESF